MEWKLVSLIPVTLQLRLTEIELELNWFSFLHLFT